MFINGCATTSKIKEPVSVDSTLIVGRITVTCNNFPDNWHINGEHKSGIIVHLQNFKTDETTSVRSKGPDGLLCIYDIYDSYKITSFTFENMAGGWVSTINYNSSYPKVIKIKKGSVNNLGDIYWVETFGPKTEKVYTKTKRYQTGTSTQELIFKDNYDEVKDWFQNTYPDSNWNNKNWTNL
jgi:hypothetical protein